MILPIDLSAAIVTDKGLVTEVFRAFMLQVTEGATITGQGSPEGVLTAVKGKMYMDEDGVAGAVLYIKQQEDIGGDRSQGWILV